MCCDWIIQIFLRSSIFSFLAWGTWEIIRKVLPMIDSKIMWMLLIFLFVAKVLNITYVCLCVYTCIYLYKKQHFKQWHHMLDTVLIRGMKQSTPLSQHFFFFFLNLCSRSSFLVSELPPLTCSSLHQWLIYIIWKPN